jgi:SAM-dependent methyltransferase
MSSTKDDPRNQQEIKYWSGSGGQGWVLRQESQDATLAPVAAVTLEHAAVTAGERVIDVGCGTGETVIELAKRVGPHGRVLGIDVSEPMLGLAARRLPAGAPVDLARADATTYEFPRAQFDLLFSRFGVMFFAEPARAFANIRTALRPGARVAFACWRNVADNPWVTVPLHAAYEHVPRPPRPGPADPGPFSFADDQRVRAILSEAGFASVHMEPVDLELDIAFGSGLEAAVAASVEIGPMTRVLADHPESTRAAVSAAVRKVLAPYQRGRSVPLGAAIWVVTARNP